MFLTFHFQVRLQLLLVVVFLLASLPFEGKGQKRCW